MKISKITTESPTRRSYHRTQTMTWNLKFKSMKAQSKFKLTCHHQFRTLSCSHKSTLETFQILRLTRKTQACPIRRHPKLAAIKDLSMFRCPTRCTPKSIVAKWIQEVQLKPTSWSKPRQSKSEKITWTNLKRSKWVIRKSLTFWSNFVNLVSVSWIWTLQTTSTPLITSTHSWWLCSK